MNKLGRVLLGNATYQISGLVLTVSEKKIFKSFYHEKLISPRAGPF